MPGGPSSVSLPVRRLTAVGGGSPRVRGRRPRRTRSSPRTPAPRRRRPPTRAGSPPRPPAAGRAGGAGPRRRSAGTRCRAGSPRPSRSPANRERSNESVVEASNQQFIPALDAAQHDALLPRLAQDDVEPVRPPDRQQARRVAAADVDDVLREHERAQVGDGALEQREVRRLAVVVGREHAEEVRDVRRRVAARRPDEADPRPLAPCQREHERVQPRVVVLRGAAAPRPSRRSAAHAR